MKLQTWHAAVSIPAAGEPKAMPFAPLSPLDHVAAVPDEGADAEHENSPPKKHGHPSVEKGGKEGTKPPYQLPPLATNIPAGVAQGQDRRSLDSRASDKDREAKDKAEMVIAWENKDNAQRQVDDACCPLSLRSQLFYFVT